MLIVAFTLAAKLIALSTLLLPCKYSFPVGLAITAVNVTVPKAVVWSLIVIVSFSTTLVKVNFLWLPVGSAVYVQS